VPVIFLFFEAVSSRLLDNDSDVSGSAGKERKAIAYKHCTKTSPFYKRMMSTEGKDDLNISLRSKAYN